MNGIFSPHVERLRRNVLVVATLALFVQIFGISMPNDVKMSGLEFKGVTIEAIRAALFIIISYNLIAFIWHTFSELSGWISENSSQKLNELEREISEIHEIYMTMSSNSSNRSEENFRDFLSNVRQVTRELRTARRGSQAHALLVYTRIWLLDIPLPVIIGLLAISSLLGCVSIHDHAGNIRQIFAIP